MSRAALLLSCLLALVSCGQGNSKQDAGSNSQQQGSNGGSNEVKITADSQQKAGIRLAQVKLASVSVSFTAPGQIMMNEDHTAHVGSYADGRVTELNATIGTRVRTGAVLARLHSHSVHETRAALQSALEEVHRQEQMVDYRTRQRDRMERLFALKSASPQEVERAAADLHGAQTDLQNARINQQKETVHLADLLRLPESQVTNINEQTEQAPILAPIDGVVVDRKVTLGTIVEPGAELFTITNLATVWMVASVSESDIGKIHLGSLAHVTTQAYPDRTFTGRVTYIAPQVDPQTRTLQARILLPNAHQELHPGMFANAQVAQQATRPSIFVPEAAVQNLNGGSVVFVEEKADTFAPHAVSIARSVNGQAEITAGLHAGEAIVTGGSFVVKSEFLKSQIGQ